MSDKTLRRRLVLRAPGCADLPRALGWVAAGSALWFALSSAIFAFAEPGSSPYRSIAERVDAMVTVKFVLKVKMAGAGADREIEGETTCLVIDGDGLVLCSNTELGGYVSLMSQMMGRGSGFDASAAPRETKVIPAAGGDGLDARLVARDSERDLAWLQVEAGAEKLGAAVLDLDHRAELATGDRFYRLRRMDKFFGSAPVVTEGVVAAVIDKPRRLLVPAEPASGGLGLPAFTADGALVGITVIQMPAAEDQDDMLSSGLSFLSSAAKLQDMVGGLILPAADVAKATRLAREMAAAEAEE
jgi:Trypsin-like peptidase domain